MVDYVSSETYNELIQKLKNLKKLKKYAAGVSKAPPSHQPRIIKNIEQLKNKLNISNLETLDQIIKELEKEIDTLSVITKRRTLHDYISGWYLRPLINHFDNVQKIQTLTDNVEGTAVLKNQLQLFIPYICQSEQRQNTISKLHQFYQFKAHGKNTKKSRELEHNFYSQFEFTSNNPFPNTTLGRLGLPVISYNNASFKKLLNSGEESILVTGLCPLSTIVDEIGLVLPDDRVVRPNIGFESLPPEYNDIVGLSWPKRPILSDYFTMKNCLELYRNYSENSNISIIIWYPFYEYYLDLTENIFKNYLDGGYLENTQITQGLNELKEHYYSLIKFVKTELECKNSNANKNIKIIEVNKEQYQHLEQCKKNVDLSFFKHIYGSWLGSPMRRQLYEQLIIKHMKPVLDGCNVLHLDNSYELWLDLLAGITVESSKLSGNYSFINYPTVPSISMSNMREFNAEYNDKLFLAEEKDVFNKSLGKLPVKYIQHIAPLLLDRELVKKIDNNEINKQLVTKFIEINNFLQD